MKKLTLLAAAALAATAFAPAALAQSGRSLALGQTVTGELGQGDATTSEGQRYEDYTLRLRAGQGVEIRMGSEAFDTVVEIGRGTGASFTSINQDDDGAGEGTNSRLRFAADTDAAFTVRARSFGADGAGRFTLAATERRIVPPPTPKPLAVGATAQGVLAAGGPTADDAGDAHYDYYTFTAAEGERFVVTMTSSAFDAFVEVGRPGQEYFEALASDDDGGGETNARALFQAPEAGQYTIRARALDSAGLGGFSVGLERFVAPRAPRPARLRVGQTVTGSLSDTDPVHETFKRYDDYVISGRAGQTITVTMSATDFDSFLISGVNGPTGFAPAQTDDDGAGELNAKLTLTFERAGQLIVRATSFVEGVTGGYTLTVE